MKICILVRILWSAGTQKFAISEAMALQSMGLTDMLEVLHAYSWRVRYCWGNMFSAENENHLPNIPIKT